MMLPFRRKDGIARLTQSLLSTPRARRETQEILANLKPRAKRAPKDYTGGHRCKVQSLLESVPFRGLYFSDLADCTL